MIFSVRNTLHFPKNDADRKVLFLDIDGVLQSDQDIRHGRFDLSREEAAKYQDIVVWTSI